jgi:MHS family proline/betaine transporter-like MFS transporter
MMDTCCKTANEGLPRQSMAKAVLAGSIGNALEWFDYGLYGYFAAIISSLFFPAKDPLTSLMLTFIVFGVGFVMRPLGGLIFGHYADKAGRRKALAATVILMGISTFAIGCLPTYAQIGVGAPILLAIFRLLQGVSTGGEWGSCMSFLAEYGTPYNRGFIVSWSQFSIAVGLLLGSAMGTVLTAVLPQEALYSWGWRIPFWTGLLIALFGMYVRTKVEETPKYKEVEQAHAVAEMPVIELFKKYRRETVVNIGVVIGWTISYWVTMAYMPTYISRVLKYPLWVGMSFNTVLLIIFMIAIPFTGILSDRIGRKPVMMIAATGFLLFSYPLFYLLSTVQTAGVLFFVLLVLAVLQALICGGATVFIPEIFPTNVRCSAIGVGYNFAVAAFGGTAPFVATWLIAVTGDNLAPTYYLSAGAALTLLVLIFMAEETYKKPLQ